MVAWYEFTSAWLQARTASQRGATLVEYVMMVALIALVCVVALGYFQEEVRESFSQSSSAVAQAGT